MARVIKVQLHHPSTLETEAEFKPTITVQYSWGVMGRAPMTFERGQWRYELGQPQEILGLIFPLGLRYQLPAPTEVPQLQLLHCPGSGQEYLPLYPQLQILEAGDNPLRVVPHYPKLKVLGIKCTSVVELPDFQHLMELDARDSQLTVLHFNGRPHHARLEGTPLARKLDNLIRCA